YIDDTYLVITLTSMLLHYDFVIFYALLITAIYILSLHDALPISAFLAVDRRDQRAGVLVEIEAGVHRLPRKLRRERVQEALELRSEEHTSELQSRENLVCRLLLEKKHSIFNNIKCYICFAKSSFL